MENLKNKEIIAFAGIGNPSNFFDLLKENNINVKRTYSFPDHHNYSQKDFDKIIRDDRIKIVTTEKDYYRMSDEHKLSCDYIEIDLEIENKNKFINLIKSKI
jgi:tetraacyldisaccharide 4'-kinase